MKALSQIFRCTHLPQLFYKNFNTKHWYLEEAPHEIPYAAKLRNTAEGITLSLQRIRVPWTIIRIRLKLKRRSFLFKCNSIFYFPIKSVLQLFSAARGRNALGHLQVIRHWAAATTAWNLRSLRESHGCRIQGATKTSTYFWRVPGCVHLPK